MEERLMRPKRVPFHTEKPMSGPPRYSWDDLRKPLLRKSPFEVKDLRWLKSLGGGMDGCCWKVAFGDQGPFVLKIFWDYEAPEGFFYWAAQREFQNAAVLQMLEASVNDRSDKGPLVRIFDNPKNCTEAIENLYAFSEEARQQPRIPVDIDVTAEQDGMMRTRGCFGWLKIKGDYFNDYHLPPDRQVMPTLVIDKHRRERPFPGREYFAIVYEYIEEDRLDNEEGSEERKAANRRRIQTHMDFLWGLGFEFCGSTVLDNWKGGILIDMSDIIFPLGLGRHKNRHHNGDARCLQRQTGEW
ncbi:hypothetical protein RB596_006762 [Gaeumannomyces avenae]